MAESQKSIPSNAPPRPRGPSFFGELWARDGRATVAAAAATIVVELGACFVPLAVGVRPHEAVLTALAATVVWVVLAAPAFAASGRGGLGALLRGGIVADASGIVMIVFWLIGRAGAWPEMVTFLSAAKIYCTVAAVALFAVAVVGCFAGEPARFAAAVGAAVLLLAASASPLWVGGLLHGLSRPAAATAAAWAVYVNPFYSVTAAVNEQTGFLWHQYGVMYGLTWIGDFGVPPVRWFAAAAIYGAAALVLGLACTLGRAKRHSSSGTKETNHVNS